MNDSERRSKTDGLRYQVRSFGCQMNVYDSERMSELLAAAGHRPAGDGDEVDLIVLNTCHIREKAAEKVYSEVGRIAAAARAREERGRGGTSRPLIAVAGCVAQAEGEEILRRAPAVDLVIGPQTYHRLADHLDRLLHARAHDERLRLVDTAFPAEDKFTYLPSRPTRGPLSAFLTVQEGCDKFCSFCVVPYTRGAEVSRPVSAVVDEAHRLVEAGAVEITLIGQNVNAYHGQAANGRQVTLAELIQLLAEIPALHRIRYTTSHPRDMSADLIAAHGAIPKLMPYLHLPIQSGSDRILKAMNRRHRAQDYLRIIEQLRNARPDIAISGDFIVGFPGETEEDFAATLALVRAVGYAQAYSFKYSPRPGTPAAEADNQVPEPVKAERLARLQALLAECQETFNQASIGRKVEVLLDRKGRHPGQWLGRTPHNQAIHVDLGTEPPFADERGGLVKVEIVKAGPHSVAGRPLLQTRDSRAA